MAGLNYNLKLADGRTVGHIEGKTFVRTFDPGKHILRFPVPSLALDSSILQELKKAGVEWLHFKNRLTGESYRATLEHFLEASEELDRGWGRQRALPLTAFIRRSGAGQQLSLFGGVR